MTGGARVTQIHCGMVRRRCGSAEIRSVALIAIRVRKLVISVHVAEGTGDTRMRSLQRKLRGAVAECGRRPGALAVA
jgi:hypothetical protein